MCTNSLKLGACALFVTVELLAEVKYSGAPAAPIVCEHHGPTAYAPTLTRIDERQSDPAASNIHNVPHAQALIRSTSTAQDLEKEADEGFGPAPSRVSSNTIVPEPSHEVDDMEPCVSIPGFQKS
ncbi:hypothetical protein BU25DRAFT_423354 [Macroventuria anomochaeta]|uniref:Uncharacterized protein n=1 Tax=Macroventuria anomochaeta TaxID=301207 RepID=A0ACB6RTN0_9PLEO|nr:uncharacterized protein BU25DRAFT_423354 [Macroventuria anomochaeta]KAF2625261.1 hypothetical protein BU25DRAFT_423354 [Macroventuria anomochaeta]